MLQSKAKKENENRYNFLYINGYRFRCVLPVDKQAKSDTYITGFVLFNDIHAQELI